MSKEMIYKCPRLEEKKRAEQETWEDRQYYFDGKPALVFPYICPGCKGGLKSRVTKDQQCTCAIIIDTEEVRWNDKKTVQMMRTLAKAIRRQKAKDSRKRKDDSVDALATAMAAASVTWGDNLNLHLNRVKG